eukprot:scaffold3.g6730.t1
MGRVSLEELGIYSRAEEWDVTPSSTGSGMSTEGSGGSPGGRVPCSCGCGGSGGHGGGGGGGAHRCASRDSMDMALMAGALPPGQQGTAAHVAAAAAEGGAQQPRPPITYMHIHEDSKLVLYGQMHVQSCDWLDPTAAAGPGPRQAIKVLDDVFCAADDPIVLFPASGGNIHQFTALTDCAVLDLMTPPYCTEEGRDCTYYRQVPGSGYPLRGEVTLLTEFDPPDDFVIDHAEYLGQPVRPVKLTHRFQHQLASAPAAALPPGALASPPGEVTSPVPSASPCSTTPGGGGGGSPNGSPTHHLAAHRPEQAAAAATAAAAAAAALRGYANCL